MKTAVGNISGRQDPLNVLPDKGNGTCSDVPNGCTRSNMILLPEVLMHVFRLVEPRDSRDIRLTHVCRRWRDLIHATPEFWVSMLRNWDVSPLMEDSPSDESMLLTFVQRSAPLPFALTLQAIDVCILPHVSEGDMTRLVSLEFDECPSIVHILSLHFPELSRLTIHDKCGSTSHCCSEAGLGAPCSQQFPTLEELVLPITLFLPALAVPSLRRAFISGSLGKNVDAFLQALRACALLEGLTVRDGYWRPPERDFTPDAQTKVHLSHLSTLALEHFIEPFCPRLNPVLAFVTHPPTTRTSLELVGAGALRAIFPRPRGSFLRLGFFPPADRLVCKCAVRSNYPGPHPRTLTTEVSGYLQDTKTISMRAFDSPWSTQPTCFTGRSLVLRDLLSLSRASRRLLKGLELHFDDPIAITKDDWTRVLHAFPNLTSLSVRVNSCRNLLRRLYHEPVCHELQTLTIEQSNGGGIHELLVAAIEARGSRGYARLRRLAFRRIRPASSEGSTAIAIDLSPARVARLKSVVDEVDIASVLPVV